MIAKLLAINLFLLDVVRAESGWTFGLIVAYTITGLLILLLLFFIGAKFDIFFTENIQEGMGAAVMVGGKFSHWIMFHKDKIIRLDGKIIDHEGARCTAPFQILGRAWVGIPGIHKMYEYEMTWEELNEATGRPYSRKRTTKFVFTKVFPYAISVIEVEDKNNLPINIVVVVNVRPTNLFTALFRVESYQAQLRDYIRKQIINITGKYSWEDIKSEIDKDKGESISISTELLRLNENVPGSDRNLSGLIGFEIVQASLVSLELAGSNKVEIEKATTAKNIAALNAGAAEEEGKGIAAKIRLEEGAKNDMLRERMSIKASNPNHVAVSFAEAIENHEGTLVIGKDVLPTLNVEEGGKK